MHGGLKRSVLFGFFIVFAALGLFWRPAPAAAASCACAPALTAAITGAGPAATCKCMILSLNTSLLGTPAGGTGVPLIVGQDPTTKAPILAPPAPIPFTSLAGYFESVWWPRYLAAHKLIKSQDAETNAATLAANTRTAEAAQLSQFSREVNQMQVRDQMNYMFREDLLCDYISIGQSVLAAEAVRDTIARQDEATSLEMMAGSSRFPTYANGPSERAVAAVNERRSLGLCVSTGNRDANQAWCPGGDERRANADLRPSLLVNTRLLQSSNQDDPESYLKYADLYIDNLFPDRAFSPLRRDLLQGELTPQAAEILTDRTAYAAQLETFKKPFTDAKADRTGLGNGMRAIEYLGALLDRAGYTGADKERLLREGQTSVAAMDYIRYKVYTHDPQTVIQKMTAEQTIGVLPAFMAMNQVTLLYDIREELKKTNLLLGTMGSVLMRERFNTIQAQSQTMTGN